MLRLPLRTQLFHQPNDFFVVDSFSANQKDFRHHAQSLARNTKQVILLLLHHI